jgi:hypothetical protein
MVFLSVKHSLCLLSFLNINIVIKWTLALQQQFYKRIVFRFNFFCLESLIERRGSLSEAGPCWNSEDRNCCRNVSSDLDWFSSHQDLKWFQRDLSHHIGKQKSPVKWNSHSLLKIGVKFYTLIDPGKWSLDQISLDIFSWSNFLIKRLKISQLIKKFDQLPKKNLRILAVDWNF